MREKHLKENLADLAYKAESDHEVQMARGDLYKIAKYAIKLHEMLKNIDEQQGLDGWVQSKITKAADYIGSVYHHLDYELKFDEVTESRLANTQAIAFDQTLGDFLTGKQDLQSVLDFLKTNPVDPNKLIGMLKSQSNNPQFVKFKSKFNELEKALQSQIPRGTIGNPIGMSKDQMNDPANQELMKKAARMDKRTQATLGSEIPGPKTVTDSYKSSLQDRLAERISVPEGKKKGKDGKACWDGHYLAGTKMKGGKEVDDCRPRKKPKKK